MSATAQLSIDAEESLDREPFSAFVCDEATKEALEPIAEERGWSVNRIQNGGVANAVRSLALVRSPILLIVDLSESHNPRADISALAEVCEPGTIVVTLGTINDVGLYRDLRTTGIHDYLVKPVTSHMLMDCIVAAESMLHAAPQSEAVAPKTGGRLVPVIGARGGVGASTAAVGCAWIVSHELKRKVALVDLDIHYGKAALAFDLEPGRGLCDALENPGRVDGLFIERAMVKESDNLSILAAEAPLNEILTPDPAALSHLVQELRANFACVVVDLPRDLAGDNQFLLVEADEVIVVTDLSLVAMRDVIRLLGFIHDIAPQVKVRLVGNKAGQHDEISKADFEKAVERKFDWLIPFDAKSAVQAAKSGKTLPQAARNAKPVAMLRQIAAEMVSVKEAEGRQSAWSRLFQGRK